MLILPVSVGAALPGRPAGDLQRFAFEPQFYAGLSPTTGVPQTGGAGGTGHIDRRRELPHGDRPEYGQFVHLCHPIAPTGQVSTLNMGTVAGVGKLFSSGGQLLMGFASELVFNFAGKNPTSRRCSPRFRSALCSRSCGAVAGR